MCENNNIFQGKNIVLTQIIPKICNRYLEIVVNEKVVIDNVHPLAYFNGAAQEYGCGGGIILHLT